MQQQIYTTFRVLLVFCFFLPTTIIKALCVCACVYQTSFVDAQPNQGLILRRQMFLCFSFVKENKIIPLPAAAK